VYPGVGSVVHVQIVSAQIVSAQFASAQIVSAQIVSGTNCIGNKLLLLSPVRVGGRVKNTNKMHFLPFSLALLFLLLFAAKIDEKSLSKGGTTVRTYTPYL
jgi:hypothetical protein